MRSGHLVIPTVLVAATVGIGSIAVGPAAAKAQTVNVELTSDGCPKAIKAKAGPITFKVTNDGADNVSEFEVMNGNRIVGEVENIAPGLTRSFTLTLKPGDYTTYCPGGDKFEEGKLNVAGTAVTESDPQADAAVAQYRGYLENQAAQLVDATQTFVNAIDAGDVVAAKAGYGPARVPYERIEPVAETFGDLDPRIDAREGDVPAAKWGGFHKLEQALFAHNTTAGMAPVADQLLADVKQLQGLLPAVQLEPATIANGAVELLNEVSSSKITGEEERYSRIDLVDFAANVEGAQAAYQAVKPILVAHKPQLATQIDQAFTSVDAALAPYRRGTTFVSYNELVNADTKALSQAIDSLAEPLSQVARVVATRGGK